MRVRGGKWVQHYGYRYDYKRRTGPCDSRVVDGSLREREGGEGRKRKRTQKREGGTILALFFLDREEMTSKVLQWEEDWFTVTSGSKERVEPKEVEPKEVEPKERVEPKEVEPKEVEPKERVEDLYSRYLAQHQEEMDAIRSLVHTQSTTLATQLRLFQAQSEELEWLRGEVRVLRERLEEKEKDKEKDMVDRLEAWKQWKERELNYALRRRQPVPFLPMERVMRWASSVGSPLFGPKGSPLFGPKGSPLFGPKGSPLFGPKGSPLFRHQEKKEREEKELEELVRGMEAWKL